MVNGSLSRQSSGLSDAQAHARMKAAALAQLENPNDLDPIMELSQETYRYDTNRGLGLLQPDAAGHRQPRAE